EVGDAGSDLFSAQIATGAGQLASITGSLSNGAVPDFEDLYVIRIANPLTFSLTVEPGFNVQMFLFNITVNHQVFGLLANDDISEENAGARLLAAATDGTGVMVTTPGDYLLAITGFNNDPLSATGAIFNQLVTTEISGPDGPGGFNAFTGWSGGGA